MTGWGPLFEARRLGEAEARPRPNRNPWQIDQDRIAFSRPFRRLQQKTQVHPLPFNAHVRNRLVHTLEVASVGRSLGYAVGGALAADLAASGRTPDDLGYLVQAVCLAHDIGNPPFGHAGEAVIADWMAAWLDRHADVGLDDDLRYFDGNAQGFRVLTRADGYRERGGLRLTLASLAAFLKYPWPPTDPRAARDGSRGQKFGFFATEAAVFEEVAAGCGLRDARHPAVWLMEAADDITYSLADLEDAVEIGILHYRDYADLVGPLADLTAAALAREDSDAQRIAWLRSRAIGRMIEAAQAAFLAHAAAILDGAAPGKDLMALAPPEHADRLVLFDAIRATNRNRVYVNARKAEFEIGAGDVLGKALEVFVPACLEMIRRGGDEAACALRTRQALAMMGDYTPKAGFSASETLRCAVDFVAGMTDNYAAWLAARLRGLDVSH